jgi:ribonuclease VapC
MSVVLDASSLIAYLHDEKGADVVTDALADGAALSVVNWAETLSKLADVGGDPEELAASLESEGLIGELIEIVSMTPEDAVRVAQLRPLTRDLGLSIADRVCIATGVRLELPVLTADGDWARLEIAGLSVSLIR